MIECHRIGLCDILRRTKGFTGAWVRETKSRLPRGEEGQHGAPATEIWE